MPLARAAIERCDESLDAGGFREQVGRAADAEPRVSGERRALETVKLGIPARRACVSSAVGITSIIKEGTIREAPRFPGFSAGGHDVLSRAGAQQPPRMVPAAQAALRGARSKQPMRRLVEALNGALKKASPRSIVTEPGKAIYRFYRDTRFSKDKTPYKDHIAASFHRRGLTGNGGAGYLFRRFAQGSGRGRRGLHAATRRRWLAIRNHIAVHHDELRRILRAKAVRTLLGDIHGEQLTRVPKGFPPTTLPPISCALSALFCTWNCRPAWQ